MFFQLCEKDDTADSLRDQVEVLNEKLALLEKSDTLAEKISELVRASEIQRKYEKSQQVCFEILVYFNSHSCLQ